MAVSEEQIKKAIALYEKMMNESAREVAKHRVPCEKDDRIQIVARELGVVENEVVFPPNGERRENTIEENNVTIPATGYNPDKAKTGKGKESK